MYLIEDAIKELAWISMDEIVLFMKGTAHVPAEGLTPVAMLELLKSGWTALPF